MRRRWIAAALSLCTVVAGHFYNRRPYKGLLFLVLVLVLSWAPGYLTSLAWSTGEGIDVLEMVQRSASFTFFLYAILVLVSVVISVVDATRVESPEGTPIRVVASLIASFVCALYVAWMLFANYSVISPRISYPSASSADENRPFRKSFTSMSERDFCLSQGCFEVEPQGELSGAGATISGRVLLANEPLANARITLMTAKGEMTDTAVTDNAGHYSIDVPPGSYDVVKANVSTDGATDLWGYSPVTGYESTVGEQPELSGYLYLPMQPLRFDLEAGGERHLLIEFHERPQLRPPFLAGKDNAAPEDVVLEWSTIEDAASYGVVISRIEEEDENITAYYPVRRLMTREETFSLSSVVERAKPGEEVPEYSVVVLAFEEDGRFISESQSSRDRFHLPEGWKIPDPRKSRPTAPCGNK